MFTRSAIIGTLFILSSFLSLGQKDRIQALKQELKIANSDSIRVALCSELAELIVEEDEWMSYNDRVYSIATKHLKTAKGKSRDYYLRFKADATANRGFYFSDHGNLPKSLDLYYQALAMYDLSGYEYEKAPVLVNIGLILTQQDDCEEALDYLNQALNYKMKYEPDNVAANHINIGSALECINKPEEALRSYKKAYEAAKKVDDLENMATAVNNIGTYHNHKDEFRTAIPYMFRAVELYKQSGSLAGEAWAYANLGDNYLGVENLDSARYYNLLAKKIADSLKYPRLTANVSGNLAKLYSRTGEWEQAFNEYVKFVKMEDSLRNVSVQKEVVIFEPQKAQQDTKDCHKRYC